MSVELVTSPSTARPLLSPQIHWRVYLWALVGAPAFIAFNEERKGVTPGPIELNDANSVGLLLVTVASAALLASQLPTLGTRRTGVAAPLLVLVVTSYVGTGLLGLVTPSLNQIAVVLSVAAPLAAPRPPLAWLARELHRGLFWIYAVGSLAALVVLRTWAMPDSGLEKLSVFEGRLHGVAGHANTLGTLLVLTLLLDAQRPATAGRRARLGLVLVLLVLTQSYTSWAAGALAVTVTYGLRRTWSRRWLRRALTAFAGAMVLMILLVGSSEPPDVDTSAQNLTGRTAIWSATIDAWEEEPVFGLGGRLWNDEMDQRYADRVGFDPGHAHNQFVNTLGQSGAVGFIALLAYLWRAGWLLRRQPDRWARTAHGMAVVVGVTMLTEVPLRFGLITSSSIVHMTVLLVLLAGADHLVPDHRRRDRSSVSPSPS